MADIFELIQIRKSIRTFDGKAVPEGLKREILSRIPPAGPFGTPVRFAWVRETDPERVRELGTYGMIHGAVDFLAGLVSREAGEHGYLDFGYCFESVILSATALGLGTCWLGGTFNRRGFAGKAGARTDESVLAATPVGCSANRRSFMESASRQLVSADRRKPANTLFFEEDASTPLSSDSLTGKILECVRLAPSATNKQPWRIVKKGNTFLFYCERDPFYSRIFSFIQIVDLGIAMKHFEAASEAFGWSGEWIPGAPVLTGRPGWLPVASWSKNGI